MKLLHSKFAFFMLNQAAAHY